MQMKRTFSIRRKARIATAAVLLAILTFCVWPAFGQYGGGGYKPEPSKPLTAAEELHKIIDAIYFSNTGWGWYGYGGDLNVVHGSYQIEDDLASQEATFGGGYGGSSSDAIAPNCYEPKLLALFRERLILNHNSKTLRDINELVDMIANRGALPARLQRIETKNAELEEKLHKPITVSLEEDATFADFLELLRNELGIVAWVDNEAFVTEDLDNPLEGTIALSVTELPTICALELILPQLEDAGYRFNDGILEILPQDIVEQKGYPRVYDVADLLAKSCSETGKIDELIATFETMFVLGSEPGQPYYDENSFFLPFQNTLLVAYLPQHRHKQLEAALFAMRNGGQLPPLQQKRADLNRELYERLQQEVTVDFEDTPFVEALDSLTKQTGLTFVAIEKEFENEDLANPLDYEVTLKMQDQSLETVLYFLMRQLEDADFIVWNGVVYIAPSLTCERKNEPYFFVCPIEQALKPKPVPPQTEVIDVKAEQQEEPFDFDF